MYGFSNLRLIDGHYISMVLAIYGLMEGHHNMYVVSNFRLIDGHYHNYGDSSSSYGRP
jgi:hypothetical protein